MRTHTAPISEVWMELHDRKRLAKLMVIQGISQRRLSADIGWKSHTFMQRLLKGQAQNLSPDSACKIAARLGVGVDDLFLVKTSSDAEAIRQFQLKKVA